MKLWLTLVGDIAYCIDKELYKAIDYLREQVRVLIEHQEKQNKRIILTNSQRMRIAAKAKRLSRKMLEQCTELFTADTVIRWYNKLIAENLIYKCNDQGLILKLNNRAENNIIAEVGQGRMSYMKLVEGPMTDAVIKRNILYHSGENPTFYFERRCGRANAAHTDYNIYYCGGNPDVSQAVLDKNQRDGVDAHSLAVDPMFVDPENGDFRFKPNSPALKLGIVPIDVSKIGLRDGVAAN